MDRTPQLDWPAPAAVPPLPDATVHLWCACLDDPALGGPAALAVLSAAERAKAAAFHFEADRRRYVAAHGMVRRLLGHYLGTEPASLGFVTGPAGKPALAGDRDVHFNLSHSGPLALVAIARGFEVGVDVEQRWEMPDLATLEEQMFTPAARRRQQRLPPELRIKGFFRRWTELEAIGKCRGTGLDLENLVPGTEHLTPADPARGFTGCVASDCPPLHVDFFSFAARLTSSQPGNTASTHPILPGLPHRQPATLRLSSP